MTAREMLELAAKAAGYVPATSDAGGPFVIFDGGEARDWNPLEDDGDALRLAVRLRLRVCCPTTDDDCALASNGDVVAYSEDELHDEPRGDLYEATRRAIVRAAAEIGKG